MTIKRKTSYLEKRHLGKGGKEKEKEETVKEGKGDDREESSLPQGLTHPALCLPEGCWV
jgi:hypothetical protein